MHPSAVLITVGTKQNKRQQVTAIHQISYESNWNRSHNYTWHKEYESLEPGNFNNTKKSSVLLFARSPRMERSVGVLFTR